MNAMNALVTLVLLAVSVVGLPRLVFRLDDLQCWWMENNAFAIMDVFNKHSVPIVVGVITRPGDCYAAGLEQRFNAAKGSLEIASHSDSHTPMLHLSYELQLQEAVVSKQALEKLIPGASVRTFIPPQNLWNYTTIRALNEAGYDIISGQCTVAQVKNPQAKNLCPTNMYANSPIFFPRIDGLSHSPVGACITKFSDSSVLLTPEQLFYAPTSECDNGRDICSVQAQLELMPPYTANGEENWASIMMHPQDWPENTDISVIEAYFVDVFAIAKKNFQLVTYQGLVGAVGTQPIVQGIPTAYATSKNATRKF